MMFYPGTGNLSTKMADNIEEFIENLHTTPENVAGRNPNHHKMYNSPTL
jgi:hypothetical protein